MSPSSLKPNVQELQNDIIKLLEEVSSLMRRASTALSSDDSGREYSQKYADFQEGINESRQNVEDLELVMSIAAPMNAGKSTIINAIIGQDLLPSRSTAMTTLPTEIVFDEKVSIPILILSSEVTSVFRRAIQDLQKWFQVDHGGEKARHKISQQPSAQELGELLDKVVTNRFPIQSEVSGCEKIKNTLTALNDFVRLCSVIDPSIDPQGGLTDVPRIKTPSWNTRQKTEQTDRLGNLVIVDTPGPNEAGEHLRLSAVVANQLRRSSMVLIILDFTALNNQAAAEVKRQVKPIIDLLGKENLYVLVNKIDQRRKGDMSSEQVQRFVSVDLDFSSSSDTSRIFEVSAIRAFSAAKFLLERQQNSVGLVPSEFNTAEALAQEVFGIDWEEDLKEASLEELQRKAYSLWRKSGFEPFLEKAINVLMENAAPRTLKSAVNRSRELLREFQDDVQLRLSGLISQDTEKLKFQLDALEQDLEHLELCRKRLEEVNTLKESLQHNLNKILETLKNVAKVSIKDYFIDKDYEEADLIGRLEIDTRKAIVGLFSSLLPSRIKSMVEYKPSGVVEFSTEEAAEEFSNKASLYARQRAEGLLSTARNNTEQEVEKAYQKLKDFLDKEVIPIVERARIRLDQAFNVQLSPFSSPGFSGSIGTVDLQVNRQTREVVDTQTVYRRPWWLLWLIKLEKQIEVNRTETYYSISLEELVAQVNESIEASVNSLNEDISKYLSEDLQQIVDSYFDHLDHYLSNYRESLRQGQADQRLPIEKKQELLKELDSLRQAASERIQESTMFVERVEKLSEALKLLKMIDSSGEQSG